MYIYIYREREISRMETHHNQDHPSKQEEALGRWIGEPVVAGIPVTRPILTRPSEKPESASCEPIVPEHSENYIYIYIYMYMYYIYIYIYIHTMIFRTMLYSRRASDARASGVCRTSSSSANMLM